MTEYRRNFVAGGSYFFTVALADRSSRLLTDHIELLRQAVLETNTKMPFVLDAMVVLPEHLHCIWTLPPGDSDYPRRWKILKGIFSRHLPKVGQRSNSLLAKGESGIWQRRHWEHTLRNEEDIHRHLDYIRYNPVKHGHASSVGEWPYSIFNRYVEKGMYPADWGGGGDDESNRYGE